MEKFAVWLTRWHDEYSDFCISLPTYKALIQTVRTTVDMSYYVLEDEDVVNHILVLLGFPSARLAEGRFGWYPQLSSGNYYCSVLQSLQAEKSIRLGSMKK